MARNLERSGGLVHSQNVLLALTQKGMTREAAYDAVCSAAKRHEGLAGGRRLSTALLAADP